MYGLGFRVRKACEGRLGGLKGLCAEYMETGHVTGSQQWFFWV